MKKFFYAAVAALALCGAEASGAHAQAGVRVGPAADEVATEAPARPKPKKDEKSPSSEKPREAVKEPARGQEPAPLSNTTAATAVAGMAQLGSR